MTRIEVDLADADSVALWQAMCELVAFLPGEWVLIGGLMVHWPDTRGAVRGPRVVPLDGVLPRLIQGWPDVAELAALVDGLRLGDARTRSVAEKLLLERLWLPA